MGVLKPIYRPTCFSFFAGLCLNKDHIKTIKHYTLLVSTEKAMASPIKQCAQQQLEMGIERTGFLMGKDNDAYCLCPNEKRINHSYN